MSHTPGPWRVQPAIGTWIDAVNPYGHGDMHIADVRGWGHLTGQGACGLKEEAAVKIQDANARLIAAAPELLAACRGLVERSLRNGDRVLDVPSLRAATAAIAKAQGR